MSDTTNPTPTTETTPATETKAKGKAADRTVYDSVQAAEGKKPAGDKKVPLRLRPVTVKGVTRYTWATDAMSAVYNAALADGYAGGEPVDTKAKGVAAMSDEELEAEMARRKAAKAAAEQPAADQPETQPETPPAPETQPVAGQPAEEAPKAKGRGKRGN
jgi:hypothetical protein